GERGRRQAIPCFPTAPAGALRPSRRTGRAEVGHRCPGAPGDAGPCGPAGALRLGQGLALTDELVVLVDVFLEVRLDAGDRNGRGTRDGSVEQADAPSAVLLRQD